MIDFICFLYSFLLHSVAAMLAPLKYDHNNKTLVQGNYMDLCVQPSNQICNHPWLGYIQQYMQSSVRYTSWWSMFAYKSYFTNLNPTPGDPEMSEKSRLLASGEVADGSTNKRRTFKKPTWNEGSSFVNHCCPLIRWPLWSSSDFRGAPYKDVSWS